ncbi:methyltransferase-like protein 27 [Mastacembelus armatus]|uniref:methyltransferase-like protein 27 n=1 Tax=Mastacembelus armatus TaxID=205130 RepID=UPI000E45C717|nr:methyltransferase-like protein 27 [Mastacembelus armatus]
MSLSHKTVDDMRTFLQPRKHFDPEQRMKFYDSWAATYEQDSEVMNYRAPHLVVDSLNANYSGNREEVQVLDVACGSGLAAKLMFEVGFRNFVGVDGSKGMLEQAEKTGLYQDLRLALLGTEPLPAQPGSFDVVVIIGALRDGFVPVSTVRELCLAAKPGGYVCMSRLDTNCESGNKYKASMESELQLMEDEGLWTHVLSQNISKYMIDVYNGSEDVQNEEYLSGAIYLYRRSS